MPVPPAALRAVFNAPLTVVQMTAAPSLPPQTALSPVQSLLSAVSFDSGFGADPTGPTNDSPQSIALLAAVRRGFGGGVISSAARGGTTAPSLTTPSAPGATVGAAALGSVGALGSTPTAAGQPLVAPGGDAIAERASSLGAAGATATIPGVETVIAPDGTRVSANSATNQTFTFTLTNLTQYAVTISYPSGAPTGGIVYPPANTVLQTGQSASFQVPPSRNNYVSVQFSTPTRQIYQFDLVNIPFASDLNAPAITCKASGGSGTCAHDEPFGTLGRMLDAPGTRVAIPASQIKQVTSILESLCATGAASSCTFDATSATPGLTDGHVPTGFTPVANRTSSPLTTQLAIADAVAAQSSWSVSAKASVKIFEIVSAEIASTYGQAITTTHTFTQTLTPTVLPGKLVTIRARDPIVRYTGDFTVVAGNITFDLSNATLTVPDGNRSGQFDVIEEPIPPGNQNTPQSD